MSVHLFLAVLDRDNTPILQVPLVPVGEDDTVMIDLTLATAVELLDAKVASSPSVYLRQVTKLSNEWVISAYVTLGRMFISFCYFYIFVLASFYFHFYPPQAHFIPPLTPL
jgi:hypothetical protein